MSETNWKVDPTGADYGWLGCPHCKPAMRTIFVPQTIRSGIPLFALEGPKPMSVQPGIYEAEFDRQGAAYVVLPDGRKLGIKPSEFRWMYPVPPYDRWCKGKGGLHQ